MKENRRTVWLTAIVLGISLATSGYFAAANTRPDHGEHDPFLWFLVMTIMLPGGIVGRFVFDHLIPQAPFGVVMFSSVVITNTVIGFVLGRWLDSRRQRNRPYPEGGANGGQPSGSDANHPSAAAGSRRSP